MVFDIKYAQLVPELNKQFQLNPRTKFSEIKSFKQSNIAEHKIEIKWQSTLLREYC